MSKENTEKAEGEKEAADVPLTRGQKQITFVLCSTNFLAILANNSYHPLLPLLRDHYDTSKQAINLTISLYVICAAISSLVFAPLSESLGRRRVFLIRFAILTVASYKLSHSGSSYVELLVLHALQGLSAGSGKPLACSIVTDVAAPKEREKMFRMVANLTQLGSIMGPLVSGAVAYASGGVSWSFWCMAVYGVIGFLISGFFLPETAKDVPMFSPRWQAPWWNVLCDRFRWQGRIEEDNYYDDRSIEATVSGAIPATHYKLKFSNVRNALKLIFWKDIAAFLCLTSWYHAVDFCVYVSAPWLLKELYNFNELKIGVWLMIAALGPVCAIHYSREFCQPDSRSEEHEAGNASNRQPHTASWIGNGIMKLSTSMPLLWVCFVPSTVIGWGSAMGQHSSIWIVTYHLWAIGTFCTGAIQTFNVLLAAATPEGISTAFAIESIGRNVLAAVAVAALQPLMDIMRVETVFSSISLACSANILVAAIVIHFWGKKSMDRRFELSGQTTPSMEEAKGSLNSSYTDEKEKRDV